MKEKILLFIPTFNCEKQIGRVIQKLQPHLDLFHEVLLVDNGSQDQTLAQAVAFIRQKQLAKFTIIQNDENYSLGGSHKVAFKYGVEGDFDFLCVYHGDDQADLNDLIPLLKNQKHHDYDCLLGSRFMPESKLEGYSFIRTYGNILLNQVCNLVCRSRIYDQGSGLNFYSIKFLRDSRIWDFPDNLTFNVYLLYHGYFTGSKISFFPISWREEDQISNAKIFQQGWHIVKLSLQTIISRRRLYRGKNHRAYTYKIHYKA